MRATSYSRRILSNKSYSTNRTLPASRKVGDGKGATLCAALTGVDHRSATILRTLRLITFGKSPGGTGNHLP